MQRDASTLFFKIATWLNANAWKIGLAWVVVAGPFLVALRVGRL